MTDRMEWDEEKRAGNLGKHKVDFKAIQDFEWDAVLTREDSRGQYGEARFVSIGPINGRLHVAVWTARNDTVRLISLRKANKREVKLYGSQT
jgi:uncharacterized DUF497 family protein